MLLDHHFQPAEEVRVIEYDVTSFPFRDWFSRTLGVDDLEQLHNIKEVTIENFGEQTRQVRAIMQANVWGLNKILDPFMATVIGREYGPILGRQDVPVTRVHFAVEHPEMAAEARDIHEMDPTAFLAKYYIGKDDDANEAALHRDGDYGDGDGLVNLWVPVTNTCESRSLWIGSRTEGGSDARPIALNYGQALLFDGVNRWHGAVLNTSGITRVSFDVRFLPRSNLK